VRSNSLSDAAILRAVSTAFPSTISLLGTYRRPKMPTIDVITYSKPAILPGFLGKNPIFFGFRPARVIFIDRYAISVIEKQGQIVRTTKCGSTLGQR
jgi:hypothetical protein